MLRSLVLGVRKGMKGNEVLRILVRQYSLDASPTGVARFVDSYADLFSAPDIAVLYLEEQVREMDANDSDHVVRARRYLHRAEEAQQRGELTSQTSIDQLRLATSKLLGLENKVPPSGDISLAVEDPDTARREAQGATRRAIEDRTARARALTPQERAARAAKLKGVLEELESDDPEVKARLAERLKDSETSGRIKITFAPD
ncbi:hypothetical protein LJR175_008333 [Variovorax sp. LjRoot175]|uniref:hypothetical protein n=1 Tax=Variovorax sp. LjRoot175 TaxID=3342276 RepID=UPI003ECE81B5